MTDTPRLVRVDLKRCTSKIGSGGFHGHPDITAARYYLAKIDGAFYAGRFSKQWYGWSFDGWEGVGLQLDKPGTNESLWQDLWEIKR